VVRERHREALARTKELEAANMRAGSAHWAEPPAITATVSPSAADPHQGMLERDASALLGRVERLCRAAAEPRSLGGQEIAEEIQRERKALQEQLLDLEQALKQQRNAEQSMSARTQAENAKLRAEICERQDELRSDEGERGAGAHARIAELEKQLVRARERAFARVSGLSLFGAMR
jgi:DNA anti-recombination protein RmuC